MDRRRMLSNLAVAPFALTGLAGLRNEALAETKSAHGPMDGYFPNFTFRTHDGKSVRFYDDMVKDKIVTFNFMYTHCEGSCPLVMSRLVKVQKMLEKRVGRDIFMYSFTLKPEEDTPKILKEYAKMYGVKHGWQFLTGDPEELKKIRYKLGMWDTNPEGDADVKQHTSMVRFGNDKLKRWCMCPGVINPAVIAKYILFVDSPKNRIDRQMSAQKMALEAQSARTKTESHLAL
ncbi:MAG: SCO family protein [Pyrinomonadaceae bacterium]